MSNRICGILALLIGVVATKMTGDLTAFGLLFILCIGEVVPSKSEQKAIMQYLHKVRSKNKTYRFRPAIF